MIRNEYYWHFWKMSPQHQVNLYRFWEHIYDSRQMIQNFSGVTQTQQLIRRSASLATRRRALLAANFIAISAIAYHQYQQYQSNNTYYGISDETMEENLLNSATNPSKGMVGLK